MIRDKLQMAKQQGFLLLYIAYLDKTIMDLPNPSEEEQLHAYKYGLKLYIKDNVEAHV